MAIELKFCKTDNSPWGFRLTGGADSDIPFTVIKVYENSVAENGGLQVDDVIVRINENPTAGLVHGELHDLILEAGQELILGIRRNYNLSDVEDEKNNEEASNMQNIEHSSSILNEQDTRYVLEESEKCTISNTSITDEQIAEVISGETEVLPGQNVLGVNFNKVDLSDSTVLKELQNKAQDDGMGLQNKKFSTFLQKPERSIVVPKKMESVMPKAPPYKVLIKKQRRNLFTTPEEIIEIEQLVHNENIVKQDVDPNENVEEEDNVVEVEEDNHHTNEDTEDHLDYHSTASNEIEENRDVSSSEERFIEAEQDLPLPLEKQLAQVQEQLQALSQLPSTIQITLEAVTKQLAKIVNATNTQMEEGAVSEHSIISEEDVAKRYEENMESPAGTIEDMNSGPEDELNFEVASNISERESNYEPDNNDEMESVIQSDHVEENIFEQLISEEEQETIKLENEKAVHQERKISQLEEFHQRRLEQRPTHPLTPLQRPIILPGGRKWSQPGDALPVHKKSNKMTDEKITKTLDTYSEVLIGHTKGLTTGTLFGHGLMTLRRFTESIF